MTTVGALEPLLAYWRAQDALFERVDPTWWGAVVSDHRFPKVQEANYARVEARRPVALAEIEADLLPALARAGCDRGHVVVFFPDDQTELIARASTNGERVVFDLAMAFRGRPRAGDGRTEEIASFDEAFWRSHRASARLFGIADEEVLDQLQAIERDVLIPAGRRWFVVRGERGRPVAWAALLVLEGVGYIDHVVTAPHARRRGHAGALTRRLLAEAVAAGAERTYLLAEPDGAAAALYERIGFRRTGYLASWVRPATG